MTVAEIYADMINKKSKNIDEVPDIIRGEVEALLNEKSVEEKEDVTIDNDK